MLRVVPFLLLVSALAALPTATAQEPEVDLVLRLRAHGPALAGENASFGFNVTNNGTGLATGIVVTLEMPEGATFVEGHRCTTTDGETATCSGEDLGPNASIGYSFTVRFDAAGEHTLHGEVVSNGTETDPSDNEADLVVLVGPARHETPLTGLVCVATEGGISLAWDSRALALHYNIYRDGGNGSALLATSTTASFLDASAAANATFTYHVTGVFATGETPKGEGCTATAIPEFPTLVVGALALVGSVVAYAAWRRRRG